MGLPIGLIGLLLLFSADLTAPPEWAEPDLAPVVATLPQVGWPRAPVPVRVRSDFAGALNGWGFAPDHAQAGLEHRFGPGSDGARGFLRFHDGGGDGVGYLRMSSVHAGDQSRLYGGKIAFAMRVYATGRAIGYERPLLRVTGRNGETMEYHDAALPERGIWTAITVDVLPELWEIDGRPATQERMRAILADVATSELRIEQVHGGGEIVDLDGVEFLGQYSTDEHIMVAAGS